MDAVPDLQLPELANNRSSFKRYSRALRTSPDVFPLSMNDESIICGICAKEVASSNSLAIWTSKCAATHFGRILACVLQLSKCTWGPKNYCCIPCSKQVLLCFELMVQINVSYLLTNRANNVENLAKALDQGCPVCGRILPTTEEFTNHFIQHILEDDTAKVLSTPNGCRENSDGVVETRDLVKEIVEPFNGGKEAKEAVETSQGAIELEVLHKVEETSVGAQEGLIDVAGNLNAATNTVHGVEDLNFPSTCDEKLFLGDAEMPGVETATNSDFRIGYKNEITDVPIPLDISPSMAENLPEKHPVKSLGVAEAPFGAVESLPKDYSCEEDLSSVSSAESDQSDANTDGETTDSDIFNAEDLLSHEIFPGKGCLTAEDPVAFYLDEKDVTQIEDHLPENPLTKLNSLKSVEIYKTIPDVPLKDDPAEQSSSEYGVTITRIFVCKKCGAVFKSHSHLRLHYDETHAPMNSFWWKKLMKNQINDHNYVLPPSAVYENLAMLKRRARKFKAKKKKSKRKKITADSHQKITNDCGRIITKNAAQTDGTFKKQSRIIKKHKKILSSATIEGQEDKKSGQQFISKKGTNDVQFVEDEHSYPYNLRRKMNKKMLRKDRAPPTNALVCHLCGDLVVYMKKHLRSHAENPEFPVRKRKQSEGKENEPASRKCKHCEATFERRFLLENHMVLRHGASFEINGNKAKRWAPRPWCCRVCSAKIISIKKLRKHCKTEHNGAGLPVFQCEVCDKTISNQVALRNHLILMHLEPKKKFYLCEGCGMSFRTRNNLRRHKIVSCPSTPGTPQQMSGEEKIYSCPICPRTFRVRKCFLKHRELHNGIKELKDAKERLCPYCGVCITGYKKYYGHVRRHKLKIANPKRKSMEASEESAGSRKRCKLTFPRVTTSKKRFVQLELPVSSEQECEKSLILDVESVTDPIDLAQPSCQQEVTELNYQEEVVQEVYYLSSRKPHLP